MPDFNFTTGSTVLPDVGVLSYNGCVFSSYFESKISGSAIKDDARRTVKYTELVLTAEGYVTLNRGEAADATISKTMITLHRLLTAQGGELTYTGRGFDLIINKAGGGGGRGGDNFVSLVGEAKQQVVGSADVAWGPVPELIEFQPLGAGRSAKVVWKVTIRIPSDKYGSKFPLLQHNFESSVSYGEDCYSTVSLRGTIEIPMTRVPSQRDRFVKQTVDDYRQEVDKVLRGIDLSRFRITSREFSVSRDKRTLTWNVTAEEKPYMDLPPNCTVARGSYTVRPAKVGPALTLWLCTLRATYVLRADVDRREAYQLFVTLVRLRMAESKRKYAPNLKDEEGGNELGDVAAKAAEIGVRFGFNPLRELYRIGNELFAPTPEKKKVEEARNTILIDWSIDEGLYLDSKTVTFSATWRICCKWELIMLGSGLWAKVREKDSAGRNLWAMSMKNIQGSSSWIKDRLDPNLDIIVDFGSTE